MPTFYTGTVKLSITSKDELILVSPPPPGVSRCLTKLRWVNNDTVSHTPDFRVKTTDAALVAAGMEYRRVVLPKRAVAAGGMIDEDKPPVLVLESHETLVHELAADPTNDPDKWPGVHVAWLDELALPGLLAAMKLQSGAA